MGTGGFYHITSDCCMMLYIHIGVDYSSVANLFSEAGGDSLFSGAGGGSLFSGAGGASLFSGFSQYIIGCRIY